MKRVLLLATTTGYQTRMFSDAAEQLGVELIYATDRCDQLADPWRDGAIPVRYHEELQSVDAIVTALKDQPIDGLLGRGRSADGAGRAGGSGAAIAGTLPGGGPRRS